MKSATNFSFFCLFTVCLFTMALLSACSSNNTGGPTKSSEPVAKEREWSAKEGWSSKDLIAGPTEILKAPLSLVFCPFRLVGKEVTGLSESTDGTGSAVGHAVLMPFRAIIDGVFSGVGYLGGGVIDTVSGGTAGVVSSATGEEEPNGSVNCVLSGSSE